VCEEIFILYMLWMLSLESFFLSDISEFAITSRKGSKCYNFIFPKRRTLVHELPRAWSFYFSRRRQPPVAAVPVIVLLHQKTQSRGAIKTLQCEYF